MSDHASIPARHVWVGHLSNLWRIFLSSFELIRYLLLADAGVRLRKRGSGRCVLRIGRLDLFTAWDVLVYRRERLSSCS